MKRFTAGLVTGLPAMMSVAFIAPVHAIGTCRTGNPTAYTYAEITAPGFTCQAGDKIYSDFSFTNFSTGSFVFTNPVSNFHTFQAQSLGLTAGFTGNYSYKVAIDTSLAPSNKFLNFTTSTTVNNLGGGVVTNKTLTDGTNSVSSVNGLDSPIYTYSPTIAGPITFSANLSVTNGIMTQFTDTLMQTNPVPGPLPVLGAAAAFGYSRELRKRIKAKA